MNNDSSPVSTTAELRMRSDMRNAPRGKKLLLINEGGVLVTGVLNDTNTDHFVEWQHLPKRATVQLTQSALTQGVDHG